MFWSSSTIRTTVLSGIPYLLFLDDVPEGIGRQPAEQERCHQPAGDDPGQDSWPANLCNTPRTPG
jgi:hypothetical protein